MNPPLSLLRRLACAAALLASPLTFAQSAAISISCGECGVFQTIQVTLDGADMGAAQPVRIVDVSPGDHEVKVIKWKSPFATEVLYTGIVHFPPGTELRAKATKGKLDVYGKGAYTPPPPPVVGPSAQQLADARAWLTEAKDALDELAERLEDSDDACVTRLSARLGALEDAIASAQDNPDRAWVDAAVTKAVDARAVLTSKCSPRNARKWTKPLDRVVARLQTASRSL